MNIKISVTAIEKKLETFCKKVVVVGVPASQAARNGDADASANNAMIAAAHEFGVAGKLPERSFIRSTLREKGAGYVERLAEQINKSLVTDAQPEMIYAKLGMQISSDVKRQIMSGIHPPLTEKTKAHRHRGKKLQSTDIPLYDTGQIIQSIHYEIRDA